MTKKIRIGLGIMLGLFFILTVLYKNQNNFGTNVITNDEIVKLHYENLSKSPFKETLKLTKNERKAAGIPPNKYFEEEYELTMNPVLGRPTTENLKDIREAMAQMRVPGDAPDNSWVSRGPDNVGGRTRAVMFDPNDNTNETVFAGGVSGGLWKNSKISDANTVWTRVDIPSNLTVSTITYDPNNTNIFYVGTGESYVGGDVNGDGVWKSEDAGLTWTNVFGGISGPTTFESASNITINSPGGLAGDYISVPTTNFGATITSIITADFILANDSTGGATEACNAFGADATGKIALIRRGSCNFTAKVKNAQDAGAIGAIVINNVDGTPIPMGGSDATITIPAVMISKADGDLIEAAVNAGTVNGTLNPISGTFTGNLVPGIQHINDIKIKDNGGVSEIYVAAGESFYGSANATTYLGGPELGLYKSVDNGTTWTELDMPLTSAGYKHEPNDIEIGADGKIWVSTIASSIYGDGGGKIFSSTDGITFTDTFTVTGANRTQIAVSSQNEGTVYILAQISGGVTLQSTIDGFVSGTTNLALPNDADTGISATDFTRGQAFYDLMLEVDPTNDQNIFTGGIDLFKSDNAGTSWNQFTHWYGGFGFQYAHADQHAMAFANGASNLVLFGNDGGVFFSNDAGTTTLERNKGFITSQFYTVGVAPTTAFSGEDYFVGGLQDNGTQLFHNASAGINSSTRTYGGDGAYSFFDQDGTDQYYIRNYVYNNGINLHDLATNTNVTINDESTNVGSFINPQALDSNLDILYSNYTSGSDAAVRRYAGIKSAGTLVKTTLSDPVLVSRPTAFTVSPHTTTSSTLLVGTVLGDILKVENADDTPIWTNIETANVIVGSISDIEFGASENEIFATVHNYGVQNIWYTNDGGVTWSGKEGNLPDMPVKAILQNPLDLEEVIIGTELGVWYTTDFSSTSPTWMPAFNGMTNAKVTDLDLRDDNAVYASTYGRGIFSGQFTLDPNGDVDGDGVLNGVDNCVNAANADQADIDGNGIGDACQDTDSDTILDINDNCVDIANTDQADTDADGLGDVCDDDDDNDGILDVNDNCPLTVNVDQLDFDNDGIGDLCDDDDDNDGVLDVNDLCKNTPLTDVVNTTGCTTFSLPANNFQLQITSETCRNSNNGSIEIMATEILDYTAQIMGNGVDTNKTFTSDTNFENLEAGIYTVCITVDGQTDYEQCFNITITEPEDLAVLSRISSSTGRISLELSGSTKFYIELNGETISTTENSIELELIKGVNTLKVYTDKDCQGVYHETINNLTNIKIYPNPLNDNKLTINMANTSLEKVQIKLYSIVGKVVLSKTFALQNGAVTINVPNISEGIYILDVNDGTTTTNFKVIKK